MIRNEEQMILFCYGFEMIVEFLNAVRNNWTYFFVSQILSSQIREFHQIPFVVVFPTGIDTVIIINTKFFDEEFQSIGSEFTVVNDSYRFTFPTAFQTF